MNITILGRIGDLLTVVLLTVVEKLPIDVLLGTAFIDHHILAILLDAQKVTLRNPTPAAIIKQHNESADAVFKEENTRNADIKTHF